MKKFLIIILLMQGSISQAQFVSKNFGEELELQSKKMDLYERLYPNSSVAFANALKCLANGKYEEAYELYAFSVDMYDDGLSCFYAGVMSELGIGTLTDYTGAEVYYEMGVKYGYLPCEECLIRIKKKQYLTEENKNNFLKFNRNLYLISKSGSNSVNTDLFNGGTIFNGNYNESNSSTYRTCPSCGGSGTCSSCHGSGGEWRDTGYYTGSGSKSWISCPSCSGSKRCFNCHGSGRI